MSPPAPPSPPLNPAEGDGLPARSQSLPILLHRRPVLAPPKTLNRPGSHESFPIQLLHHSGSPQPTMLRCPEDVGPIQLLRNPSPAHPNMLRCPGRRRSNLSEAFSQLLCSPVPFPTRPKAPRRLGQRGLQLSGSSLKSIPGLGRRLGSQLSDVFDIPFPYSSSFLSNIRHRSARTFPFSRAPA